MNSFPVRFALIVLGLLVGSWLALGARAISLESDARAVIDRARAGPVAPAEVARARDALERARRLSPDQGPLIREGELLGAAGDAPGAKAVAKRVTDAEPDNLQGWLLAWAVADPDKRAKAQAKRRLLELNPWFAEVLRREAIQGR